MTEHRGAINNQGLKQLIFKYRKTLIKGNDSKESPFSIFWTYCKRSIPQKSPITVLKSDDIKGSKCPSIHPSIQCPIQGHDEAETYFRKAGNTLGQMPAHCRARMNVFAQNLISGKKQLQLASFIIQFKKYCPCDLWL